MKTKRIIFIFIIFFLVFFLFVLWIENKYELKIEIETQHQNPLVLDKTLAKNIEKELLQINGIKDVVIFSSKNGCKIYFEFSLFCKNEKIIDKIERRLTYVLNDYSNIKSIKFDENYSKNYSCFIVVSNKGAYNDLKKYSDLVLDKLLKLKISSDIKIYGLQQKANYIYFSNNDLLNFDINLEDLCQYIKTSQTNTGYFENINVNGVFRDIDDIKNLVIYYKDKNFSAKFSDIFQIEEKIKIPKKQEVFCGDKKAIIFAISPKNIFSLLFLKQKMKDFEVEIINPNLLKKVEIYLTQNSDIEFSLKKYKEIISELNSNDTLGFIGSLPIGFSKFDETFENRIVIFYPKSTQKNLIQTLDKQNLKYFLNNKVVYLDKKNNSDFYINPITKTKIDYKINEYALNDYGLNKNEVISALLAKNEGLFCDYYWQNEDKIEVILKNVDEDSYFYSKKYKNLISAKDIIEYKLLSEYVSIARRNQRMLYLKKPKTHL